MTTFHHPQKPFGTGQYWPRARPQCPDIQCEAVCCLSPMLLTTDSGSVIGGISKQSAPPKGTHLWHINLEGRSGT